MVFVREKLREFERSIIDLGYDEVTMAVMRLAFWSGAAAVSERLWNTAASGASEEVGEHTFGQLVNGSIEEWKKARSIFPNKN